MYPFLGGSKDGRRRCRRPGPYQHVATGPADQSNGGVLATAGACYSTVKLTRIPSW